MKNIDFAGTIRVLCMFTAASLVLAPASNAFAATDCGNGVFDSDEECDDGDNVNGDGCDEFCVIEPGYACANSPNINTGSDGAGGVLANGTNDPVWTWTDTQGSGGTPAVVIGQCNGAWIASPFPGANWISRTAACANSPENAIT